MTQVEESKHFNHFNQKSQIKTEWVVTQKLSIAISKNLGGCENLYSRTEPQNTTKESCMYKNHAVQNIDGRGSYHHSS